MPSEEETRTPPISPPRYSLYTASYIEGIVNSQIESRKRLLDKIGVLKKEECTFESTAKALADHEAEGAQLLNPASNLQSVSPIAELREKSVEAEKRIEEFSLEAMARLDVYKSLLHAQENVNLSNIELTAEEQLLLKRMISDRTRSGLGLDDDEKRSELLKLRQRIKNLESEFLTTCREDDGFLMFTKEELEGVPEDVLSRYTIEDGTYKVTCKIPEMWPVFSNAHDAETRKRAFLAYEGQVSSNAVVLDEIVKLRHSAAQILGYPDHASYVLEEMMAKSAQNVFDFLDDLNSRVTPLAQKEIQKFLALKTEVVEARGEEFDGQLYFWDHDYYARLDSKRTMHLEYEKIKEYFPLHSVVPAVLDLFHRLLNVKFCKVPDADIWHEDTELYAAYGGEDPNEFLGYLYLDLFARPSAFGGFGIMGFAPGSNRPDGGRYYPIMTMKANFSKPTEDRPALLSHGEVVIFLHEMGHAVHALCTKAAFARNATFSVDFIEAPSQLLENWVWDPSILKEISSHFERPTEKLDDATIANIVKSRHINSALYTLKQLHSCYFDMKIHTTEWECDQTKLWSDSKEKLTGLSMGGEYIAGQSSFQHMAFGYAAAFYAYNYSEVFSTDMFKTAFAKDPMNAQAGRDYRRKILEPGRTRDPMEMLTDFLGRKPNNLAYLESLQSCEG